MKKFYVTVQLMERDGNKSPFVNAAKMVWRSKKYETAREQYEAILGMCRQEGYDLDRDEFSNPCKHQWEEQPGEPAVDVCISCGKVRE